LSAWSVIVSLATRLHYRPNGLAFSPDGSKLYVADSVIGFTAITEYPVDRATQVHPASHWLVSTRVPTDSCFLLFFVFFWGGGACHAQNVCPRLSARPASCSLPPRLAASWAETRTARGWATRVSAPTTFSHCLSQISSFGGVLVLMLTGVSSELRHARSELQGGLLGMCLSAFCFNFNALG